MTQVMIPHDASKVSRNMVQARVPGPEDPSPTRPTPKLDDWMPTAAEMLGYDPRVSETQVKPNPDAGTFWQPWLDRVTPPVATEEMFTPWVEVAVEESEAYDPIVGEHWPTN
jgi:hypothetical protein